MKDEPSSYQLAVKFQLLHGEGPGPSPASRRTASLPYTLGFGMLATIAVALSLTAAWSNVLRRGGV